MAQIRPISPTMNAVSDWIQSCATFDSTLNPTHQQLFQQYHYNPLNSIPYDMNNDILAAMTLASSSSPPKSSTMNNSTLVQSGNAINVMTSEAPRDVECIDTVVWPHFTSSATTTAATGANSSASTNAFFELPIVTVEDPLLWEARQDTEAGFISNCHDQITANKFQTGIFGHAISEQQRQQSSSLSYPYFTAATFTAPSVGSMSTMNAMGAGMTNDQFSAMIYSWSPDSDSTTLSHSSVSSSPCLSSSTPPANTASSHSSDSSLYSSSSSPYLRSSTPSSPYSRATAFNNNNTATPPYSSPHDKFKMRPMSMLTCRQQAMLRTQSDASGSLPLGVSIAMAEPSRSYASSSSTSTSTSTSSTMSNAPLTCQICRKSYANNSTLRRHLKIHLYANSSTRTLDVPRSTSSSSLSPNSFFSAVSSSSTASDSSGSAMSHKPLLCSGLSNLSLGNQSSSSLSGGGEGEVYKPSIPSSNLSSSIMISGYNPSSDPDIKKPECVGCNKAFARRDTVILHIKNQKRKWDLLSAMLPALTASSLPSPTSFSSLTEGAANEDAGLDQVPFPDTAAVVVASNRKTGTGASAGGSRRVQRQRRSHPLRMVEKLWLSTLQKKRLLLASTGPSSDSRVKKVEGADISDEDVEDEERQEKQGRNGDGGEYTESEEVSEDGWPSFEAISRMDSQTKLKWMMKTMVMPPCWKERKVRLFGAFGVMEERVLQ